MLSEEHIREPRARNGSIKDDYSPEVAKRWSSWQDDADAKVKIILAGEGGKGKAEAAARLIFERVIKVHEERSLAQPDVDTVQQNARPRKKKIVANVDTAIGSEQESKRKRKKPATPSNILEMHPRDDQSICSVRLGTITKGIEEYAAVKSDILRGKNIEFHAADPGYAVKTKRNNFYGNNKKAKDKLKADEAQARKAVAGTESELATESTTDVPKSVGKGKGKQGSLFKRKEVQTVASQRAKTDGPGRSADDGEAQDVQGASSKPPGSRRVDALERSAMDLRAQNEQKESSKPSGLSPPAPSQPAMDIVADIRQFYPGRRDRRGRPSSEVWARIAG